MEIRIRYDFKSAMAIGTGPETARVLIGTYVGLPNGEEQDVFDLYRMDNDGEPVGECQGQMGSTISEVTVAAEKEWAGRRRAAIGPRVRASPVVGSARLS